jgi:hypothetical protein
MQELQREIDTAEHVWVVGRHVVDLVLTTNLYATDPPLCFHSAHAFSNQPGQRNLKHARPR